MPEKMVRTVITQNSVLSFIIIKYDTFYNYSFVVDWVRLKCCALFELMFAFSRVYPSFAVVQNSLVMIVIFPVVLKSFYINL